MTITTRTIKSAMIMTTIKMITTTTTTMTLITTI